jgi:cell division transport system ATP-binding protein
MDEACLLGTVKRVRTTEKLENPAAEPPILRFENVKKEYGSHVALDDMSFTVDRGQLAFLVGASGAGKTTVLRLLTRELVCDAGTVEVAGRNLSELRARHIPQLRRVIAVVPQDYPLLPGRDIVANIRFALAVLGWPRAAAEKRCEEVLELVGLSDRASAHADQLSGGERQRAAIARAIASQPKILLADEPTGNLDPGTTVGIMRLLDRIAQDGTTVLVSTHDRAVVDALRRQVIAISDGRVVRSENNGAYAGKTR